MKPSLAELKCGTRRQRLSQPCRPVALAAQAPLEEGVLPIPIQAPRLSCIALRADSQNATTGDKVSLSMMKWYMAEHSA